MSKTKLFAGVLLVLAVLFAQAGTALAAPVAQDTTISGTIQTIKTETDEESGVTTVVVPLLSPGGETQTVRLSVEDAAKIMTEAGTGLVTVNSETQEVTVNDFQIGQTVEIDPTIVIQEEEEPTDEYVHPIAAILAKFFEVEPSVVQSYHEDGYGFGVIAQAMWMAQGLGEGDLASADNFAKFDVGMPTPKPYDSWGTKPYELHAR